MIKIQVKKLFVGNKNVPLNKAANVIGTDMGNSFAIQFGERLKKEIGNKKCPEHPNHTSTIIITAQNGKGPKVSKYNFCCDEFKNSFKFTVRR